jgi:hypothetical protein
MAKHVTMTAQEAEALFEAAEYARKHRWSANDPAFHAQLNSAISKLRRADTITIGQEDE